MNQPAEVQQARETPARSNGSPMPTGVEVHESPGASPRTSASTLRTVLLVGLPRSGSTLLSYLLAGIPSSLSLSEPYLAQDIYPHWRLRRYFKKIEQTVPLKRVVLPRPCCESTLLEHMQRVATANGLGYLLIKETYRCSREWKNSHLLERLAGGGGRFVGLHRHPYDIAVSSLKFCKWWRGLPGRAIRLVAPRMPLFPTDRDVVEHCADNWTSFVTFCRRWHIPAVKYEDLVTEPQRHLQALCSSTDLPFHDAMLDHTHPRSAFGGIGAPEVLNCPPRPVSSGSVGRSHLLSGEFRDIITARCKQAAGYVGYEL